jgi:hypothetical protein
MNTAIDAYSREELDSVGDELPAKGPICPKCQQHIPQFVDLSDTDRFRIKQLILSGQNALATQELRATVHCPITWAKLWVTHSGHPDAVGTSAPCPYCGKKLKTALAKQCPHCNMDWHDPDKPIRLGT